MGYTTSDIFWIRSGGGIYTTRRDIISLGSGTFEFNINPAFDRFDWSREPTTSLKALYKARAEQLRDTHGYLILYFSGGSDSITVLNAFLDNSISLDEVVINSFPQINADVIDCAYAKRYLRQRGFTGKVTLNDIDLWMVNEINRQQLWTSQGNFTGLLHNLLRFDIDFFEENDLITPSRRCGTTAHIFGSDYPAVVRTNGSFYCIMHSNMFTLPPHSHKSVAFFTSPDMPELHVKQSHVLARYMEKHGVYTEKECKISIRDEFNPMMFPPKTGGRLDRQFYNGSENSLILNSFFGDREFKDLYVNVLYREILKPRLLSPGISGNKRYLLF
jgi:hypothetical protein